jgi:hypothetical protein
VLVHTASERCGPGEAVAPGFELVGSRTQNVINLAQQLPNAGRVRRGEVGSCCQAVSPQLVCQSVSQSAQLGVDRVNVPRTRRRAELLDMRVKIGAVARVSR